MIEMQIAVRKTLTSALVTLFVEPPVWEKRELIKGFNVLTEQKCFFPLVEKRQILLILGLFT